jgi:putative methionine-R-sulfoxide reductase with GAF domain
MANRPYDEIAGSMAASGTREQRMQSVADALWEALNDKGVSWVGFYVDRPGQPDDQRLLLGPCRNKAACSPIGLHGVCGQAVRFRRSRIVPDVADLGTEYIACDPEDRSEIAVPLVDDKGTCWAVLDLDSRDVGAFDETDEQGLYRVLRAAGLDKASD